MKKTQRLILLVAALLIAALMICGCSNAGSSANPEEGKTITVTFEVVQKDGASKEHTLTTEKATLAEALAEAKLIEYDAGGFYTTIDGITADWSVDESWWAITKGGEMLNYGLNDITIADGEHYEATYTIGY